MDETSSNRGGIGVWSFGASVFVSEDISLGGSMDFWHGTHLNELDSTATDVSNIDYNQLVGTIIISLNCEAINCRWPDVNCPPTEKSGESGYFGA